MGYTTWFAGHFDISPALDKAQVSFVNKFCSTRRMKRDPFVIDSLIRQGVLADPERMAVGLPVGVDGGYFVGGLGFAGQNRDDSVIDDVPPNGQPGLWCRWVISDDGKRLSWNGEEKFYDYTNWLAYLISHFFSRWDASLSGVILFQGEDEDDSGFLSISDGSVLKQSMPQADLAWVGEEEFDDSLNIWLDKDNRKVFAQVSREDIHVYPY